MVRTVKGKQAAAPPKLTGDAARAVEHRGSHLQIIAAAGSGKTEVVSQRVADLLADGVPARAIVAFTFTERAAAELKDRIAKRVEQRLGPSAADRLVGLFVGTIHSFCFQLLQRYVPRYETYDVLDENQLTAFLSREATRLGLRDLDPGKRLFAGIQRFARSLDVVENELLDPATVPGRFGEVLRDYLDTLDRYRLLTFGQQIVRAVHALDDPEVARRVHADVRHLIVDEYQDINPAQERLIERLAAGGAEVCVVGDDDQAIYQWRGSDVANIVGFAGRYRNVATFTIGVNRRSRPAIIKAANAFATSIPGRLPKQMRADRPPSSRGNEVVAWTAGTAAEEADHIARMIRDLHDHRKVAYRDIAVLVRGRVSYPALLEAFAAHEIPVQPGGRTGLFDAPDAVLLGQTYCWLADVEWRSSYGHGAPVTKEELLAGYQARFRITVRARTGLDRHLDAWKDNVDQEDRPVDLVGDFYRLCEVLRVRDWDLDDPLQVNRLGTLARFTMLLTDYESVRRRARVDGADPGEQVGGSDRGVWHYRNLALHIVHYAQGAYDGFDGEPDVEVDAVDVTTVHRAKGLEWPVVFVPAVTARRFPSSMTGRHQDWALPRTLFHAARYEGCDADERRLFYVAITRARDFLSVSCHRSVTANHVAPSLYFTELQAHRTAPGGVTFPDIEPKRADDEPTIALTFSDLSQFLDCALAYRLRTRLGFQPRLAPALGYGKAVHHVLRSVADHTRRAGKVPSAREIDRLLDQHFFLPTANRPAHRQMKEAARRLIGQYVAEFTDDLHRVWESERPFELRLDGVTVSGRADVILDKEGGEPTALAILDYKTSTGGDGLHDLQLQIYANAGRREGLDVRGAYVHDLNQAQRSSVDVSDDALRHSEAVVADAAKRLRAKDFTPNPGPRCRSCEVRAVCGSATG